jgi:hypothetical protein
MRWILAGLLTLLVACSGESEKAENNRSERAATPEAAPGAPPRMIENLPRYVGRWSPTRATCLTQWWRLWHDEVRTSGNMHCSIQPPDAGMGDERRRTVCQFEGLVSREQWVFTYPGPEAMSIARDGGIAVSFVKCG